MLRILLATCETTLDTLRVADNPVYEELVDMLGRMIDRTRNELRRLTEPSGTDQPR